MIKYFYFPDSKYTQDLPFYIHSMGLHYRQDHVKRPEGFEYNQFLYCSEGSGEMVVAGKKILLPANSIIFIPAGLKHEYYPTSSVWDIRWLAPAGSGVKSLLNKLGFTKLMIFPIVNISILDEILGKMHLALQIRNNKGTEIQAASYVYQFILEFYRQYCEQGKKEKYIYRKRLAPVLEYVKKNLQEKITQGMMCEIANVTPQHLCRMFHACLDMRPMEYLARVRINQAMERLVYTEDSIEQIACYVGIPNVANFRKVFRKFVKVSPREYRLTHRIDP